MDAEIQAGNVNDNAAARGWFLGHFIEGQDPRSTGAVEAKWGTHKAGEEKPSWTLNSQSSTLSILVRGRFRIRFPSNDVLLAREGDFAMWSPGTPHHWIAEEESVVLTIRWPSIPGDVLEVQPQGVTARNLETDQDRD